MRSERLQKRPVALKLVGQVSETKQRYMFNIHNQSAHEMIEDYIAALRTIAGSGGGGDMQAVQVSWGLPHQRETCHGYKGRRHTEMTTSGRRSLTPPASCIDIWRGAELTDNPIRTVVGANHLNEEQARGEQSPRNRTPLAGTNCKVCRQRDIVEKQECPVWDQKMNN